MKTNESIQRVPIMIRLPVKYNQRVLSIQDLVSLPYLNLRLKFTLVQILIFKRSLLGGNWGLSRAQENRGI